MKSVAEEIVRTVHQAAEQIRVIPDDAFYHKPHPGKWSLAEILGHLVDSAQNNIQRFVRAQYEDVPHIVYNQDEWVRLSHYRDYNREELLMLWQALNHHLSHVLSVMNPSMHSRTCDTGKTVKEVHDLKFIAEDYLSHLRHHLKQIEAGPGR
jgi:hypothetical protein